MVQTRTNSTKSRFSTGGKSRLRILAPPALVLLALAAMPFFFDEPLGTQVPRGADLCPIDRNDITGRVLFLVDFRKPLDGNQAGLPGQLLRDLTADLGKNTEFQVFTLTGSSNAPRALLKRLCKPYDNTDLQVAEAKDQNYGARDCNDLPAQIADDVRQSAARFCSGRELLQRRLNAMAGRAWPEDNDVVNSYLVEAFEDVRLELGESTGPHQLYVFSDMMQHAPWYSHLDTEWMEWNYDEFAALFGSRNGAFDPRQGNAPMRVDIFYVPRIGTTDQPRAKALHREFWRNYFAGTEITFHDQPPMPAYAASPLMNVLTETEIAAQERAAIERLLVELEQEQEALGREQRELEAERQRQAEAERELEAERPAETERTLEAERQAVAERDLEAERQAETERTLEAERQAVAERELEAERQTRVERPAVADRDVEAERPAEVDGRPAQQEGQAQLQPPPVEQQAAEPPVATQPEVTTAQTSAAELPLCALLISGDMESLRPDYPRRSRMNLGDAQITVRYVIDESGATINEQVTVVPERSSAERERYFELFAGAALDKVRTWTFSFIDPDDTSCRRRQTRSTLIAFDY